MRTRTPILLIKAIIWFITFVEILAVSFIVGILAALIVPTVTYAVSRKLHNERDWGNIIQAILFRWYDYTYAFTGGIVTNDTIAGRRDPSRPDIWFDGRL